jgi:fructose-specific phosphotransferase system IIA component
VGYVISDLMTPARVTLDLKANDRKEAVRELAALLLNDGALTDLDAYLAAVEARESLGTTAVGFGIAIPHAKSHGVAHAAVAFGRSNHGVAWTSLDDDPAQLIFLIAAPEGANDVHLNALARLARRLMHDEVRQQLLAADTAEAAIGAID